MRIEAIGLKDFPPFADAVIEFPKNSDSPQIGEVQLLTGQNGTGKTRVLSLLAAALGNRAALEARIAKSRSVVVAMDANEKPVWWRHDLGVAQGLTRDVPLDIESIISACENAKSVVKLHQDFIIPSKQASVMAAAFAFRGAARVSDAKIAALDAVKLGLQADHLTFEAAKNEDQILCQCMANLTMTAAMDYRKNEPPTASRAIRLAARIESTVSSITGRSFAFHVTYQPDVSLRVYWGGVAMKLGQLPDGLRSIIGWLVSCVAKLDALFPEHPDPLSLPLILLLDEPESHLHPAWQRQIIPAAQTLFPQAQIFVATHSPFVISSVNDGWIHILRANAEGLVTADPPRPCSKGDSWLDAVEDVLGLKERYDPETETLLAQFRTQRDEVRTGGGDYDQLLALAKSIALRSDALNDIMGREMWQLDRQLGRGVSAP